MLITGAVADRGTTRAEGTGGEGRSGTPLKAHITHIKVMAPTQLNRNTQ